MSVIEEFHCIYIACLLELHMYNLPNYIHCSNNQHNNYRIHYVYVIVFSRKSLLWLVIIAFLPTALFHARINGTLGIDIGGYSHRATLDNVNNIPLNFDRRSRGDPTLNDFDHLMSRYIFQAE